MSLPLRHDELSPPLVIFVRRYAEARDVLGPTNHHRMAQDINTGGY